MLYACKYIITIIFAFLFQYAESPEVVVVHSITEDTDTSRSSSGIAGSIKKEQSSYSLDNIECNALPNVSIIDSRISSSSSASVSPSEGISECDEQNSSPHTSSAKTKPKTASTQNTSQASMFYEQIKNVLTVEQDFAQYAGLLITTKLPDLSSEKQMTFVEQSMKLLKDLGKNDRIELDEV